MGAGAHASAGAHVGASLHVVVPRSTCNVQPSTSTLLPHPLAPLASRLSPHPPSPRPSPQTLEVGRSHPARAHMRVRAHMSVHPCTLSSDVQRATCNLQPLSPLASSPLAPRLAPLPSRLIPSRRSPLASHRIPSRLSPLTSSPLAPRRAPLTASPLAPSLAPLASSPLASHPASCYNTEWQFRRERFFHGITITLTASSPAAARPGAAAPNRFCAGASR